MSGLGVGPGALGKWCAAAHCGHSEVNAFTSATSQTGNYWNVKQPPVPFVASQTTTGPGREESYFQTT